MTEQFKCAVGLLLNADIVFRLRKNSFGKWYMYDTINGWEVDDYGDGSLTIFFDLENADEDTIGGGAIDNITLLPQIITHFLEQKARGETEYDLWDTGLE